MTVKGTKRPPVHSFMLKNKGNPDKSMIKSRAQVTKHYGPVQPLYPLVIKCLWDHRGGM